MGITVIENGSINSAMEGWHRSRDLIKSTSAGEVATLDASVNELPSAMFHFKDMMILERELVVTARNHVIWARTSRVDDPRLFTTPAEFAHPEHSRIIRDMRDQSEAGVHQDQWRLALPLCALTSWTTRLSYRDAIRLANYFKDVAGYVHKANPMLAGRLRQTANDLRLRLPGAYGLTMGEVDFALAKFKPIKLQAESLGTGTMRKFVGEFVSMQAMMPIATRAQLVRHREIMVADDLLRVLNVQSSHQLPISTKVTVQATALASTWATVLGKRTCWMAQADLWKPLADLYGCETEGLPCADGQCPYAEDAKQRLAGNDPGAPCPRYSNLTETPMTDGQWEAAMLEAKARPSAVMWRAELGVSPGCHDPRKPYDENLNPN